MNAAPTLPAVWRLIETLRDASRDPVRWASYAKASDDLPEVPISEAGAVAHMISKAAIRVLQQLPHAHPSSRAAAQMTLLSLSDWLNQEATAHGCDFPRPYYDKD